MDKTDHPPFPPAFAELGVRPSILRGLAEMKFQTPSEIQKLLIPRALAGVDILGQARTGTGKTAAFGIPLLQQCDRAGATQAIILVPTRELCVQVDDELKRLGQFTPIRSLAVYGGQKIAAQMKFLHHHPQILVGTPGRVIDLLDRRIINFQNLRFVVLDEVDRMLDIGFRDDIRNILGRVKRIRKEDDGRMKDEPETVSPSSSALPPPSSFLPPPSSSILPPSSSILPPSSLPLQTILVSATISDEIERLARTFLREPVEKHIAPGADDKPTVEKVEQYYLSAVPWDKYRLLRSLLEQENPDLAIVFCRTKHGAAKIARRLHADGIECREIHGNLDQNKRDKVMKSFRGGKFDVLIATDLASRGIDVADISHIINFDIPEDPEAYVHRIGRTARMGAAGKAFTLVTPDQGEELTKIENLINMIIPQGTLQTYTPAPRPADWLDEDPNATPPGPAAPPPPSRFATPLAASGTAVPLPPRTLGSKLPLLRRHRRRR